MNARELYLISQWLDPLMRKKSNPATVDYVEVEIEDPSGNDHTFRISSTGDTREPWQLTGLALNGRFVVGQQCWCHFRTCAALVRALRDIRKGNVTITVNQPECELILTTLEG